ncbi:MAG: carbamoyl-phosphate synthase large subunit [Candidatus Micrarchaeia archaeon]
MPKREDIEKVLVIGSGPIVIGQAAEFDYSGSQACTALREEGVQVVLVNSNPATIQTDLDIADIVYIEPLKAEFLEKIIEKERPQGLIATMGGQTGLNLAVELERKGVLKKYGVEVLGTGIQAIKEGEDRDLFVKAMERIGEPVLKSIAATSVEEALEFASKYDYPFILRPAYCLGGTGSSVAHSKKELIEKMEFGLRLSPAHQVLVEQCVLGWAEIEYEMVRDSYGNAITVCNMENIDPMGIHTGDSIVVAPSQTLSQDEYQMLRHASLKIVSGLNICGGCNIQYALNQETGEYYVIEINPRLSRSSALASKASGYPIARVAAKVALGFALDEIPNAITKKTPASFEPALDYVVVKIPRWPFDKMPEGDRHIGTQMKGTGEVMGIGRTFEEALQKAIRSTEIRREFGDGKPLKSCNDLRDCLKNPTDERIFAIYDALKQGMSVEEIVELTKINPWFIRKILNIVRMEQRLRTEKLDENLMREAKRLGFSDRQIAMFTDNQETAVRRARKKMNIKPVYKMVDTCAAEFEAKTPYYYSTYESECEANPKKIKKVIVIGAGPIRIGQGIEFDYCCCHASFALREAGVQSIIINNNPETVSTDFDASDKLYFEPLTFEDVMNVIEREEPDGVIVQFGGQTSINLAVPLAEEGVTILGTQIYGIDIAEDRERFRQLLKDLDIPQPANGTAKSEDEALDVAEKIGYPIVVRPSYVIAGRAMAIVPNEEELKKYITEAVDVSEKRPVLIDKYLDNAIECEIDGVSDEKRLFIGGIMEHIEKAGVHSGDASCVTPPLNLSEKIQKRIVEYSKKITFALRNIGAINIQYAVQNDTVYVLEANPRASRTIPYLSKATGIPLAKVATRVILGQSLEEQGLYETPRLPYYAVKSVCFPFLKLPGVDPVLGPEMKSTGESMGIDANFGMAYYKSLLGANMNIPLNGRVIISLRDSDKKMAGKLAESFEKLGFKVSATKGTAAYIGGNIEILNKLDEQPPNMLSKIRAKDVQLIINTPSKGKRSFTDGFKIRRAALESNIPIITTIEAAFGLVGALNAAKDTGISVCSTNDYLNILKNIKNK